MHRIVAAHLSDNVSYVAGIVKDDRVSVERVVNSDAGEIFALIADAGQHPSFDGSGTVQHATQDSVPLSKGSKFGKQCGGVCRTGPGGTSRSRGTTP